MIVNLRSAVERAQPRINPDEHGRNPNSGGETANDAGDADKEPVMQAGYRWMSSATAAQESLPIRVIREICGFYFGVPAFAAAFKLLTSYNRVVRSWPSTKRRVPLGLKERVTGMPSRP